MFMVIKFVHLCT